MDQNELKELKQFCRVLANSSADIIKTYFRQKFRVESKQDDSPVTIADKKAEEGMRESIMKFFPEHGIIGEEFGKHNENAKYTWVLDPIDGTKSFICGATTFGTLISLLEDGKPILGVFNQPILNEFLIGDNEVALLNDIEVKVHDTPDVKSAVLNTTDYVMMGEYHGRENFERLINSVKLFRMWGDCYGYYLLATGFSDIMIDPVMHIWDTAALLPIVNGAGGVITDYKGNDPLLGDSIVAATPKIHADVIKILNGK